MPKTGHFYFALTIRKKTLDTHFKRCYKLIKERLPEKVVVLFLKKLGRKVVKSQDVRFQT